MKITGYLKRTPWAIIGVFSVLAVGSLIIGYFYYDAQKTRIRREQHNSLSAIADLKSSQINQWRNERMDDGEIIRSNPLIAHQIAAFFKNPAEKQTRNDLFEWMRSLQSPYGYNSIYLCDLKGVVRCAVASEGDTLGPTAHRLVSEALRSREVLISDLHRKEPLSKVHMVLVVPIIRKDRGMSSSTGVLVLRIDPDKVLFPLVQSWPTPSPTSETLLIRREGDNVLYLNELRHLKNTALRLKFPVTTDNLIAAMALRGVEGTVEGVDYRGVQVLSAIRKIPDSPWFIIAKIDQSEVYAMLHTQAWTVGIIAFLFISTAGASIGLWWRHQRSKFYREKYTSTLERQALVKHFEYLVKFANDIILLANENLQIIEVNEQALKMYGYASDEMLGLTMADLCLPGATSNLMDQIKALGVHQGGIFETVYRRKDGSTFFIELSIRMIEIEGRKFYQTIGRDITEWKLMEEALRKSEEKFRRLFQNSSIGIYQTTPAGEITLANPTLLRLLGYSSLEELSRRNLDDEGFEPTYPREQFKQLIETEGEIKGLESAWKRKDGTTIYVRESARVHRGPDGEILYYEGTVEDITDRRHAEEALRQSEKQFRALIEHSQDAVTMLAEDGTILYDSPSIKNILGYEPKERLGKKVFEYVDPVQRQNMSAGFAQLARNPGSVLTYEGRFVHKDGTLHWFEGVRTNLLQEPAVKAIVVNYRDITERKLATEQLELLKHSIDLHYDGAYWMDGDGRFVYANEAGCKMLGYTHDELLTMSVSDINPKATTARWNEILNRLRVEGSLTLQSVHRRKDGSEFPVELTSTYVKFGEKEYHCGFARDITERKRAEEKFRSLSSRNEAILASIPDIVMEVDNNKVYRWANRAGIEFFGDDVLGKDAAFYFEGEQETYDIVQPLFDGKDNIVYLESWQRRRDGEKRLLAWWCRVLKDAEGNATGALSTARDITEHKKSQEALRESEERFRLSFENANTGMCLVDTAGNLMRVNNKMGEIFGYSKKELECMNVNTLAVPEDMSLSPEFINKAVTGETESGSFEKRYFHKKGHVVWGLVSSSLVSDANGNPSYFISQVQDITEQKKLIQELSYSEEKFAKAFRASPEALSIASMEDGRYIDVNDIFLSTTGFHREEVIGRTSFELNVWVNPDDRKRYIEYLNPSGHLSNFETRYRMRSGEIRDFLISAEVIEIGGRRCSLNFILDITERKNSETKILKLNRTYAVISNINQLIVRERDKQKLLEGVCKIAVNDGGFSMAWIGLLKEDVDIITPAASAGSPGSYLEYLNLTSSETPEGRGRIGVDLRNGLSVVYNDIAHDERTVSWRDRALGLGYKSSAVFPLCVAGTTVGTFSFYSKDVHSFSMEETQLVDELARDVSFALESLEIEEQRTRAEEALQISEKNFRMFIESAPYAVFVQTRLRFSYLNPAALKLFGVGSEEQLLGQPVMDRFHPDFMERIRERIRFLNKNKKSAPPAELKFLTVSGRVVDVDVSAVPIFYEGHDGALVFVHDITERKQIERYTETLSTLKQKLINRSDVITKLHCVTDGLVEAFDADFARVWIIQDADLCEKGCCHAAVSEGPDVCRNRTRCLHLMSSSGRYTHTDGDHRRVPFGCYKIGRVASGEEAKFITNDVSNDVRVHNREWAKSLGLVSFAGFRLTSPDGTPIGVIALFRNRAIVPYEEKYLEDLAQTTSQVIVAGFAEKALEESESRARFLAGIVEHSSQSFAVGYPDGRLSNYNKAFSQLVGYTQEELISLHWNRDLTPPEWREIENAKLEELIRTDQPVRYEKEYIRKDGSRVPIELLVHLLRNEKGQPEYFYAFITDITERKQAEEALIESNMFNEMLLRTIPFGMDIVDTQGNILFMSDAMKKLLGTEGLGEHCWRVYKDDGQQCQDCPLREGIEFGKQRVLETAGVFGGKIFQISHIGILYRGKEALLEVFQDITDQKRLQYQLIQSQKVQSIGTLAGGIAHDFNNILGIIMGYASLLERGGMTNEKFLLNVNAIKQSVERGASLVRQILTFARKTDVSFEPVHIPEMVRELLSMLRETFSKMIAIEEFIEDDIPMINADKTQLHQALLNLCVNSRDAMPIGGELTVTVDKINREKLLQRFPSADQNRYVCIKVSDTGIGMSEETKSQIFDPFFTTKERGKGTGLGLSVVLGVIQTHHGFVDVESTIGVGTTFCLYIPLPYQRKKIQEPDTEDGGTIAGGSETILVVEDEILLLEFLQSLLESNGYRVLAASDGLQAVELYSRHHNEIALVITDMGMPRLAGSDEIKKLREINKDVKIILASGFLEPGVKAELLKAGAKGVIQKPYVPKNVLRLVRDILDGKQS